MTELKEPCNLHTLGYLYNQLPQAAMVAFEKQCRENEDWQDRVDYVSYLLEELCLPQETPFDLVLTIINYEMLIRKEKIKITLDQLVQSEEESYELEIEIDKLLSKMEVLANAATEQAEEPTIAPFGTPQTLLDYPTASSALSPSPLSHSYRKRFAMFFPSGRKFLDATLQQLRSLLSSKKTGKREVLLRFPTSNNQAAAYAELIPSLTPEKIARIQE